MSFIKHIKHTYTSGNGGINTTIRWQLKCDICKKKFVRTFGLANKQKYHYCGRECSTKVAWTKASKCPVKGCPHYIHNCSHNKKYCSRCVKDISRNKRRERRRAEIYKFFNNKCVVCKETNPIYFQIDHVNNDATYSKTGKYKGSVKMAEILKEPDRFQLMCANCNHAKRMNGGKIYKPKKKRKVS